jgi:hypothetical protein
MRRSGLLEHFHFRCLQGNQFRRGFCPSKSHSSPPTPVHTRGENAPAGGIGWFAGLAAAFLFALAGATATPQDSSGANRISYEGTLGSTRIGMTLIVKGDNVITGGHYFYAKYLTDIPLTGTMQPGAVTLKGQDGGSFDLRFKGNGSEGGKPLDFNNSVGLEGTWSKEGKSLPVKLGAGGMSSAVSGWYADVTDQSDAAFEAKAQAFYKAALAGDKETAAKYVAFPLRVNHNGKGRMIHSAAELTAQWESIFTPAYLAALKKDIPHDMGVSNGQAMLGPGEVWFGDKGVTALNLP